VFVRFRTLDDFARGGASTHENQETDGGDKEADGGEGERDGALTKCGADLAKRNAQSVPEVAAFEPSHACV
jgi:hypothetical protein